MKTRALIMAVLGLGVIAAPANGTEPPVAHAWGLRILLPGNPEPIVVAADALARAGGSPRASASPLQAAGNDPMRRTSTQAGPAADEQLYRYEDPTGSFSAEMGYVETSVTTTSSSASSGFGAGNGSGFSLADEFFTFEQQEMLLNQWKDLMDAVVTPLNDALGAAGPVFDFLGMNAPRLEGIAPEGLIDVATGNSVGSSATASSSPGFSSARASTSVGSLRLFGGFIEARAIKAEAVSESIAGADERTAEATLGSVSVAGLTFVGDRDGLRLEGTPLIDASTLRPLQDIVLGELAAAGLHLESLIERAVGVEREAIGLAIRLDTPAGPLAIEIARAMASAPSVAPTVPEEPGDDLVVAPPNDEARSSGSFPSAGRLRAPGITDAPAPSTAGPLFRRPGADVARAIRTAFVLSAAAALLAALVFPLMIRRGRALPRPMSPGGLR